MKKIIIILLAFLAFTSYGQADFEKIAIHENVETASTSKIVSQQPGTGELNYINATALPISTPTQNALDMKLNISDLPVNLTLYPTTAASDVGGYVKMVTDIHDADYNTVAVDVSTPTITGTAQLVSQRISAPGVLVGQPGVFNISNFGNIRRLSGTGSATFYFEVYHRDSAGVETLICTSGTSAVVSLPTYVEFTASAVWNDGEFEATDRIVIKTYANRIPGNSDPVYQFQFGGVSPVRTLLPVPFSVVDAGYELKANKQNSLAIDGTGTKYPTVDAVNSGLSAKENVANKSDSYTASSSTTYASTKALVDGVNKNDISKYGVLPTNSAAVNSVNILNVPDLVDMIFLEGVYEFSEPISYRGNNIVGVSNKTVLKFSNSAGIVLDTSYGSSFFNYVINKEFRNFKIESRDECINFCHYSTIIESFAYSKFINLSLKSELSSAFKSDLVVSGDDFIGYANSFKNLVVETPTGAVFENMCLAVSTSIDNLHDLNSQILFKNCKLELECSNLNFGFGFNLKHIIFNELSESNYHKVTFNNCNFEQMVSNPIVNLNANSVLNVYFKNSYIQFGTGSNSLVGKQFYAFNPSYTDKTVNAIVSDTYTTSKQFYPFIGLMTFVDFKNCTYRLNTTTVNESLLSLNIAHIIASSSNKVRSTFQDDYLHQNLYNSDELITYSSYEKTEKVKQITPDVFINIDENEDNVSRNYVLANNFIEKALNVTSYGGEYLVSSLIIFNLSAEQEILFDHINKGVDSNSTLTNKGLFNINIYVDGINDPILLPNHTYIYNQVSKSVLDITETYARINSPTLTGTPTAPTAAVGTNTTQIATMEALQAAVAKRTFSITFSWATASYAADASVYYVNRESTAITTPTFYTNNQTSGVPLPFNCKIIGITFANNFLASTDLEMRVYKVEASSTVHTQVASKLISGNVNVYTPITDYDTSATFNCATETVSIGFLNPTTNTGNWRSPSITILFQEL